MTIVEMEDRLLSKEDEEVSAEMERLLRADGLNVLLKTKAVRTTTANGHKQVTVEREGRAEELHAEEILVATGRWINTEGLNLEAAGVKYDQQ